MLKLVVASSQHFEILVETLSGSGMLSTTFPEINGSKVPMFVKLMLGSSDSHSQFLYLVYDEDLMIGLVGATVRRGVAEVGCILTPVRRGVGLGYQAHELLFNAVVNKRPDVKSFLAVTSSKNLSAIKMLIALGFESEIPVKMEKPESDSKIIFYKHLQRKMG